MATTTVIEDKLAAWLAAEPTLSPLHGGRVYPFAGARQNTAWPFVTYFRVSGPRVRSLRGPSGVSHPRIQIDSWGLTYLSAKRLAEAVRAALGSFRGDMGGVTVQVAMDHDDQDGAENPTQGDEATQFRVTNDFTIWFEEQGS